MRTWSARREFGWCPQVRRSRVRCWCGSGGSRGGGGGRGAVSGDGADMSAKTATILLVDDEPNVTDALKRALRREPYEILTAISGPSALELLERHHAAGVISDG